MNQPTSGEGVQFLWPTPVLVKRVPNAGQLNAELVKLFENHRQKNGGSSARTYSSSDDLLEQHKDGPVQMLGKHLSDGVFEIGAAVNGRYWKQGQDIRVEVTGLWFQISNDFGFHETHGHGNCSWSGVYYVRSADAAKPAKNKNDPPNGVTRFYGPYLDAMSGGHGDFGNLYLHDLSWDSTPEDGKLVIFPSWLKHMAFPYSGGQDRIVVSFHAQIHGSEPLRFADQYSFS